MSQDFTGLPEGCTVKYVGQYEKVVAQYRKDRDLYHVIVTSHYGPSFHDDLVTLEKMRELFRDAAR